MKPKGRSFAAGLAMLGAGPHAMAAVMDITPGLNNLPIQQVTYTVGAVDQTQTSEAAGVVNASNASVTLKSVRISDGGSVDLAFFNTEGAKAVKGNPQLASIGGVGVFDNGTTTTSNGNLQGYLDALGATSTDTDLRNFGFHDYLTPGPTNPAVPDLDLLFYRALNIEDYVMVLERWGNSSFEVTALMADGTPYVTSNTLRLGGPGAPLGVGYTQYDWNTGFAAAGNNPDQAQVMMVFSVEKFFEGTQGPAGPVYGLRIGNRGEADTKIVGVGSDTFSDNPINPQLVPEPSSFLLAVAGSLFFVGSRRRRS